MSHRFGSAATTTALVMALSAGLPFPVGAQLRATLVAEGLTQPLGFVQDPSDKNVQIVLEQPGRLRVLRLGVMQSTDFLDLRSEIASGGERGLLGFAFAPDFATSGRVFVSFTNRSGHSVVSRFRRANGEPFRADPASRFDLLWPDGQRLIEQPFTNHNGGNIAFGPDGFLYIGMGDGGSSNDPMHLAQHPATLLGKMLRIDVAVPDADTRGYRIPASNPFVSRGDVLHEIWAFGLRNPWRWSFDDGRRGGTGALVIGDVGQGAREEVNYEPAGAGGRNYGWRNREGTRDNVTSLPPFSGPLIDPIWEYPRSSGGSITGGVVYRGLNLGGAYIGRYFFADFVSSRIWSIALTVDPVTREATATGLIDHTAELGPAAASPSSFGVDGAGEIYVVSYSGRIYRIDGPGPADSPVRRRPFSGNPIGFARPRP